MRALEQASTHCMCPDDGPLCDWHRANLERLRRLYAVEYSDDVLEELTRPEPREGEAA